MRQSLAWALGLTVLASGWSLWSANQSMQTVVAPARRNLADASARLGPVSVGAHADAASAPVWMPPHWAAPVLAKASRNPFDPARKPTPAPTRPPRVVLTPEPTRAPEIPQALYQLVGKMMGPDGKPSLYLQHDNKIIEAHMGDTLSDGYTIEAVSASSVSLVHPASGHHVTLELPETRD